MSDAIAGAAPSTVAGLERLAAKVLAWPSAVAVTIVNIEFAHEDFSFAARLYASGIACLALWAATHFPVGTVPALAVGLAYFYSALGLPIFSRVVLSTTQGPARLGPQALESALAGGLIAAACMSIACVAVTALARRRPPTGTPARAAWVARAPANAPQSRLAMGLALTSIAVQTVIALGGAPTSISRVLGVVGASTLSLPLLRWSGRWSGNHVPFYAGALYLAVLGLRGGMIADALMPGVIVGALLWAERGRIPVVLIVVGALTLVLLNPAKHAYRQLTWWGRPADAGPLYAAEAWLSALESTYAGTDSDDALDMGARSTRDRLSTIAQVAQIYALVPASIPHAGADKWLQTPLLLVPRMLWEDKPVLEYFYNKDYTHTFKLQDRRHTQTSITVPTVGDGYWRLGWFGVVCEGLLMGVLLGCAQAFGNGWSLRGMLIGAATLIVRTDYHAFGTVMGVLQQGAAAWMFAWVIVRTVGNARLRQGPPGPRGMRRQPTAMDAWKNGSTTT